MRLDCEGYAGSMQRVSEGRKRGILEKSEKILPTMRAARAWKYCEDDGPPACSPAWGPMVSPPVSPLDACSPFASAQSPPARAALHGGAHPFGAVWLAEGRSGAARPAAARESGHYDEPSASPQAVVYL